MNRQVIASLLISSLMLSTSNTQAQPTQLNVNITGNGEVKVENTDANCTSSCVLTVDGSEKITVQASPNAGFYLSSWGDLCPIDNSVLWENLSRLASGHSISSRVDIADLNGDGFLDLSMQTMQFTNTAFSVALNKGNGSYAPSTTPFIIESFMTDIKTFDWDNDDDQDVLLVDYDNRTIYLYTNDGSGNFVFEKDITVSARPVALAISDINDDGSPDLLISSFKTIDMFQGSIGSIKSNITDSDLSWYLNDGNDAFNRDRHVSDDAGIYGIDIADYDNDGDLDIVAASLKAEQFFLYTHESDGYASTKLGNGLNSTSAYDITFGDINNDKLVDIVGVTRTGSILLSEQQVAGGFPRLTEIFSTAQGEPQGVDIADIDNDGDKDIVVGIFESNSAYYQLENIQHDSCSFNVGDLSDSNLNIIFTEKPVESVVKSNTENEDTSTSMESSENGGVISYLLLMLISRLFTVRNYLKHK